MERLTSLFRDHPWIPLPLSHLHFKTVLSSGYNAQTHCTDGNIIKFEQPGLQVVNQREQSLNSGRPYLKAFSPTLWHRSQVMDLVAAAATQRDPGPGQSLDSAFSLPPVTFQMSSPLFSTWTVPYESLLPLIFDLCFLDHFNLYPCLPVPSLTSFHLPGPNFLAQLTLLFPQRDCASFSQQLQTCPHLGISMETLISQKDLGR